MVDGQMVWPWPWGTRHVSTGSGIYCENHRVITLEFGFAPWTLLAVYDEPANTDTIC